MEKERNSKVMAVVALCIGVVGISLGFAAFSRTLTISSGATVKPSADTFKVYFSASPDTVTTANVAVEKDPTNLVVGTAAIDNTGANTEGKPSITNLSAEFTAPGQSVTYTFYARNEGEYEAFLNAVSFENATDANVNRVCTGTADQEGKMPTDALVQAACDDITLSISVGGTVFYGSEPQVDGHSIQAKGSTSGDDFEPVVVTIAYKENGDVADGNFSVKFGDITLTYDSIDIKAGA